ncbi:hypothetical protein JTB14_032107 [Gonioctena quinquepunctata]|nr:hypothetical protein JTB14_032107 [Gonioctena quinquepunctata]
MWDIVHESNVFLNHSHNFRDLARQVDRQGTPRPPIVGWGLLRPKFFALAPTSTTTITPLNSEGEFLSLLNINTAHV